MSAGESTPIVLLHALPLDSSMWRAQTRALEELGHEVLALDQQGFGQAPLVAHPPSLDAVADDLVAELASRGIDQVILAGCSMGGYAAMAFLRRRSARVAALALLSTRAEADTAPVATRRRLFARAMREPAAVREALVEATTPALVGATSRARHPERLAELLAVARAADPASVAWAQEAIAARQSSLDVLRATDVPALVVVGDEDELVTVAEARTAADALPRGKLVVVPGAGHLLPLEAPDRITELLAGLHRDAAALSRTARGGS